MTVLVVVALLAVSAISVAVGLAASSGGAFAVAAIASGAAVILLWRESRLHRPESTFVSNPPTQALPDWDRPLREPSAPQSESLEREEVAIDAYEDLVASEILILLETLSLDELEAVIRREKAGLGRLAVINRAQILIDLTKPPALVQPEVVIDTEEPRVSRTRSAGRSPSKSPSVKKTQRNGPDLSI